MGPIKNLPVSKNEVSNQPRPSEGGHKVVDLKPWGALGCPMGKNSSSIMDRRVTSQNSSVEDCTFQRATIMSPIPDVLLHGDLDILPIEGRNLISFLLHLGQPSDLLEQ